MADRAELNWVNVMRAMCMMGVYVWHSETFTSAPDVLTPLISPFCMAAFFFVSGYLFYRKAFCEHDAKFYATCFSNILFRLVLPTLLFSVLLYVPRTLFHGQGASVADFLICTIGGTTLWFTCALALMQLFALLLLRLGLRNIWALLAVGLLLWLGYTQVDAPFNALPWSYTSAMRYFVFFVIGGCFFRMEGRNSFANGRVQVLCLLLCIIAYLALYRFIPQVEPMLNHAVFLFAAFFGTMSILFLSRLSPRSAWLSFVGRRSISFYFLCGIVPAATAKVVGLWGLVGGYSVGVVFFVSLVLATLLSWIMWRWFPGLFDLRRFRDS